jgi:putative acetyltransferase
MEPFKLGPYHVRPWQPKDRQQVASLIEQVLTEYGLHWAPENADIDVIKVEKYYEQGQFWVLDLSNHLVGTGAYYARAPKVVEIRKMYFVPSIRGLGLGSRLLEALEQDAYDHGYEEAWIETSTLLTRAVSLYERSGYERVMEAPEVTRCDRVYHKKLGPRAAP